MLTSPNSAGSMVPVHERLQHHGLRALIYSGDHDYVVPFTGTRAWLHSLGRAHRHRWQAWTMDGQVGSNGGWMAVIWLAALATVSRGDAWHWLCCCRKICVPSSTPRTQIVFSHALFLPASFAAPLLEPLQLMCCFTRVHVTTACISSCAWAQCACSFLMHSRYCVFDDWCSVFILDPRAMVLVLCRLLATQHS